MKATVTGTRPVFEPIHIDLVIESEEELQALWHRCNAAGKHFNGYLAQMSPGTPPVPTAFNVTPLYIALDSVLRKP